MILTTIRYSNCKCEICMNGVKIQQIDNIKCLGFIFDNKLS